MSTLLSILVFVLILSVLVFVHELGHFLLAKWTGMRVDEFAIGFPPRLVGRRWGETTYAINAVPIGGYVRIHGENPDQVDQDPRSFQRRPIWARIVVIVAGVFMNLLFAFLLLTAAFSVGYTPLDQTAGNLPGARVSQSQVVVIEVVAGLAADKAQIQPGDFIRSFRDEQSGQVTQIGSSDQLVSYTKAKQQVGSLRQQVELYRDSGVVDREVTLQSSGPALGVQITSVDKIKLPFWRAPQAALHEISLIMSVTWDALKGFAHQLFFHATLDKSVSGPVGIYKASSAAAQQGPMSVLRLLIVLSVNLALLNILPVPALDGGRLLFLLIELVFRRRVVSERIENWVNVAGMTAILALMAIITVKDVLSLF